MRFARVHKVVTYLLAALGLGVLGAGGELAGAVGVLLVAGVVGSWFAEGELLRRPLYVYGWNALVVVLLLVQIARATLFAVPSLTVGVQFAALLQLSRLANRRTANDYQQITVLAALHLVAASVLGAGLSYAAFFLGFVVVMPWALTLGHLRREIEGNYVVDARTGQPSAPIDVGRILRSRRVVGPGLLLGSSALSVPLFFATALVTIVFPRVGFGVMFLRGPHENSVAGLGDQVDLTGHGTIRDDPRIVVRIETPDAGTNPDPGRHFRLRGASYDLYDGRGWARHSAIRQSLPRERDHVLRQADALRAPERYRVVLDPLEPPVLLVPLEPYAETVALRLEPRMELGVPWYPEISRGVGGELHYSDAHELGVAYTAVLAHAAEHETLSAAERARSLALPTDIPIRILELARQLTADAPDAFAKATAVQRHLSSFRYSLALLSGEAAQPVDDFLFRTHAGHCEYFSTAMAVLLRAAGVPTRNVTGYFGGSYNRWGRFYSMRQGDAHSWVEVFDDRYGWVTFDPTPPGHELFTGTRSRAWTEIDAMLDAMRMRWLRYVVGFDLRAQARMASRTQRWFRRIRHEFSGAARSETARNRGSAVTWARLVGSVFVALAAVALTAWLIRRWRARCASEATTTEPRERQGQVRDAIALALALDRTLAALGHTRPLFRSPVGFADDVADAGAPVGALARRVARRYAEARFGDRPLDPREVSALRDELADAARAGLR